MVQSIKTSYRRRRPTVTLKWEGRKAEKVMNEALFWSAIDEAKLILRDARNMTPEKTGTLIRSSTITVNRRPSMPEVFKAAGEGKSYTGRDFFDYFIPKKVPEKDVKEILISFNTPYAVIQHERTDLQHPRGGGPKYLQKALEKHAANLGKILGQAVRGAFLRRR